MDTHTLQLLHQTTQYFAGQHQQAYLVGGSLRNILLGEPSNDWDIVTNGDAHKLARGLANKLGGYYVHMHEKASRVIIKQDTQDIFLDISPLQGKTLEEDLHKRDFTINAIAAPLDEVVRYFEAGNGEIRAGKQPGEEGGDYEGRPYITLIDPFHGIADIEARRLRAVHDGVFRDDPLRMLRAVRLMMRYRLSIDPWTERLMTRGAGLLAQGAAERIHDELYAILEPEGAAERLRFLDAHGLLTVLIPEFITARGMRQPPPHYWDVLEHSLETVGALERVARMLQREDAAENVTLNKKVYDDLVEIRALLYEAEQQGIFAFAALAAPRMKMAALLHDIGKPVTYTVDQEGGIHFYNHPQAGVPLAQQVMKRLSASTQDRRLVQLVVAHHMRPGQLAHTGVVTPRAIRRYFVDLGPIGIYVALISLADHLATMGPQPLTARWERHLAVVRLLLTRYIRERESILPPRLIAPEELMRRLKLEPGPLVGELLEEIAEARADGTIHSKEEALWLAEERLHAGGLSSERS